MQPSMDAPRGAWIRYAKILAALTIAYNLALVDFQAVQQAPLR